MEFRNYLLEAFRFNDHANRRMIRKIATIPDPKESVRLISHLILSQDKWLARIKQDPGVPSLSWWEPVIPWDELEQRWQKSLDGWLDYIEKLPEAALFEEAIYLGPDQSRWAATPADIALQLIYHSVHHRAQIQQEIRRQGLEPDFIDYIGTKYRKL